MAHSRWLSLWRSTGEALVLAAIFAIPVFGGVLIGITIDRWQTTQPIFTLGLLGLGMAGGFYGLIAVLRRMNRRKR